MPIGRRVARLAAVGVVLLAAGCTPPREQWNVLLVTFDTTRADAIGPYGHPAGHTPNLDRLAAEGTVFERCFSAVPITAPSHSTILTGTYPPHHGVRDNGAFALPSNVTTLAELLREAGYRTGAAIGAFPLARRFGLDQGFEVYDDSIEDPIVPLLGLAKPDLFFDERSATEVNAALLPWLESSADEPFFAWFHYWDPHHPHHAPPPYAQLFEYDPYLAEIAYADEALGQVLETLRRRELLDRTLVIVTADHGEGRGEHREETHSILAYNSTLQVPLILRVPGVDGGRRVEQLVGTVDIVPTVLELLGLDPAPAAQGRSLVATLAGTEPAAQERAYYAETLSPRLAHGWSELRALYFGDHKLIFGARPELYDQRSDLAELTDLAESRPRLKAEMADDLRRFVATLSSPEVAALAAVEADAETLRRLEALGYISTDGVAGAVGAEVPSTEGDAPQDRVEEITRVSRIKTLLVQGEAWTARREAERLVSSDETNPYYRELLARALLLLERPEEAYATVRADGPKTPGRRFIFLRAAQHQAHRGSSAEAEETLREVLVHEDSAIVRFELAALARTRGDNFAAETELGRALDLDSDFGPARLELGSLLTSRGELDAAGDQLSRAVELLPLHPAAHFRLGELYLARSEPTRALARFDRARELAPDACYPQTGRAEALRALGRDDDAREVLVEILLGCDAALRPHGVPEDS